MCHIPLVGGEVGGSLVGSGTENNKREEKVSLLEVIRAKVMLCASTYRDNLWIVLCKPWIRALHDNLQTGCTILGLHPTKYTNHGLMGNPGVPKPWTALKKCV